MTEPIYHLALASDWAAAQDAGEYAVSTRGRTLAEVGYLHASRADQWQQVRASFYTDLDEPLLLLTIDTDRLTSDLRVEDVPEAGDSFPHIYGPLNLDAVVDVTELPA